MKLARVMCLAAMACLATATVVSACGNKAAKTSSAKAECNKAEAAQAKLVSADGSHCAKTKAECDKAKARVFQQNILGIMNGGAMALMVSLGHKTGLFDAMDGKAPRTAEEIAAILDTGVAGVGQRPD